jgi:hypothetical protein
MNPIMVVTLAIHWGDREGHVCENAGVDACGDESEVA